MVKHSPPETFDSALVERLRGGRAVLVVGLGSATLAGLPPWPEVIRRMAERLPSAEAAAQAGPVIEDLLKRGRRTAAVAYLRTRVSDEDLAAVLGQTYAVGAAVPAAMSVLAEVPWRSALITGFDDLWTRALGKPVGPLDIVAETALAVDESDTLTERSLINLFGGPSSPAPLCLTTSDLRAGSFPAALASAVRTSFADCSFVFFGFEPGDPDFALLLQGVLGGAPSSAPHFLIWAGTASPRAEAMDVLQAELAMTVLPFAAGLEEVATRLVEAWRPPLSAGERVDLWLARALADPAAAAPREALDRVEAELRSGGEDAGALAELLIGRARLEPLRAVALKLEASRLLADGAGREEESIALLREILMEDPTCREAADRLTIFLRRAARWPELVEILAVLTTVDDDRDRQIAAGLELGEVRSDWLNDADGAVSAYRQVLSLAPDSLPAVQELADLLRRLERWPELADALVHVADLTPVEDEALDLLRDRARMLGERVGDLGLAALAWEAVAARAPGDIEAFDALEQLHRANERWLPLVEAKIRHANACEEARRAVLLAEVAQIFEEKLDDPAQAADFYLRAAELFDGVLGDAAAAEGSYRKAAQMDTTRPHVLVAVGRIALARQDHVEAVRHFLAAEAATTGAAEKAKLLCDAAVVLQDNLGDIEQARALFARVFALDPDEPRAAVRLASMLEERGEWVAAVPVLEILLAQSADAGVAVLLDLQSRMAKAATKAGDLGRALQAYEDARAQDPGARGPLWEEADLRFANEHWEEAARLYEELIRGHEGTLGDEQAQIYQRLGLCMTRLGDPDTAARWTARAGAPESTPGPVSDALAEQHLASGDQVAWVRDARVLLETTPEAERAPLYERIGDAYRDQLGNPVQAIAAYRRALEVQPGRRSVLEKLSALYQEHKHWRAAVEVLGLLAQSEPEGVARAAILHRAAIVQRDEVENVAGAADLLRRALEADPASREAFDALAGLLREAGAWKELARVFRSTLEGLGSVGHQSWRARLWQDLGALCARQLGDRDTAKAAFAAANALEPTPERQALLAEVSSNGRAAAVASAGAPAFPPAAATPTPTPTPAAGRPVPIDEQIAAHQRGVAAEPERLASYRALAQLYRTKGAFDESWCLAATLSALRKADDEQRAFYETHRARVGLPANVEIPVELWRRAIARHEQPLVGRVLSIVAPWAALATAEPAVARGLHREVRANLATDRRLPSRALALSCRTLGVAPPDLFYDDNEPGTLALYNLREDQTLTPALVIGAGIAGRKDEREVVFLVARAVALLRAPTLVRAVGGPPFVESILQAALALGEAVPPTEETAELRAVLAPLIPPTSLAALAEAAHQLVIARPEPVATAWIEGADLAVSRMAFVLAGDLGAAARVTAADPAGASAVSAKHRLKDLVAFSVSEEYFALRRALGMALTTEPAAPPAVSERSSPA